MKDLHIDEVIDQHTPEPWKLELYKTIFTTKMYWLNENTSIGTEKEADAERIMACVNACSGVPSDLLSSGVLKDLMYGKIFKSDA